MGGGQPGLYDTCGGLNSPDNAIASDFARLRSERPSSTPQGLDEPFDFASYSLMRLRVGSVAEQTSRQGLYR